MSYAALVGAWKEIDDIPAESKEDAVEYIQTHVKSGQLGDVAIISITDGTPTNEPAEIQEP